MSVTLSRDITDYFKGIAILSVLVNHYVNSFISQSYVGFANGIIAIFFILSGYGIHFSLIRLADSDIPKGKRLGLFFLKRALRILPVYYLFALPLIIYGNRFSFWQVFPLIQDEYLYLFWFVPYIIQCYLLAPLLFAMRKRVGVVWYCVSVAAATAVMLVTGRHFFVEPLFDYRLVPFGHVMLFALGLALPDLLDRFGESFKGSAKFFFSTAAFAVSVQYTRKPDVLFDGSHLVSFALMLIALTVMMGSAGTSLKKLPLRRVIVAFGAVSYPLLLMHEYYFYRLLNKLGIVEHGDPSSVAFVLLFLPFLYLACRIVEDVSCNLARRVYSYALKS